MEGISSGPSSLGSKVCLFFSHIAGWSLLLITYIHQKLEAPGYLCIGVMVGGRCSVHRYPLLKGVFTI